VTETTSVCSLQAGGVVTKLGRMIERELETVNVNLFSHINYSLPPVFGCGFRFDTVLLFSAIIWQFVCTVGRGGWLGALATMPCCK